MKARCLSLMLCIAACNSLAEPMTAGDLQAICISTDREAKSACRYYILGVSQGISLGMSIEAGQLQGRKACVPDLTGSALELAVKIKMGQELMVFPDDRKLDASGVVGAILVDQFPCGKK